MSNPTLLKKIQSLIQSVSNGSPPLITSIMATKLAADLHLSRPVAEPVPDEVWEYFKTLPPTIQGFIIGSLCHGLVASAPGLASLQKVPKPTVNSDEPVRMPIFRPKSSPEG